VENHPQQYASIARLTLAKTTCASVAIAVAIVVPATFEFGLSRISNICP
jgi:hypothetical protein